VALFRNAMFSHFDRTTKCDRHMEEQADGRLDKEP